MSNIKKIAQELEKAFESGTEVPEKELDKVECKKYLAFLKALKEYYQYCHWVSKGDPYYGDHLLFERLYNEVSGQIDSAAEKFIGLGDESIVFAPEVSRMVTHILSSIKEQDPENISGFELAQCALKMEKSFVDFSNSFYRKFREDGSMTLGLDDMVMANHNEHEGFIYLLKQRIKSRK